MLTLSQHQVAEWRYNEGTMMKQASRYILYAQISCIVSCVICLFLKPDALSAQSGISYFGNFKATFIPYIAGLGLASYFLLRAAHFIRDTGRRAHYLRLGLYVTTLCLLGIALTPSFLDWYVRALHVGFAVGLFGVQAYVSRKLYHDVVGRVFFVIQMLGMVGVVLSFRRVSLVSIMIPAQLIALSAFSAIAIRSIHAVNLLAEGVKVPEEQV